MFFPHEVQQQDSSLDRTKIRFRCSPKPEMKIETVLKLKSLKLQYCKDCIYNMRLAISTIYEKIKQYAKKPT